MAFQERLRFELTLSTGGKRFTVPGGQVESCSVHLTLHGFTASVTFWTGLEKDDAALFTAFSAPDLLKVRLAVSGGYPLPEPPPEPLVVQGLALTRRLEARTHGTVDGAPVRFRRYTVDFADAARVVWRQHRPTELLTGASLADLLAAHTAGAVTLECDWDVLDEKRPLLCLALGEDAPGTSFHDFVLWLVHTHGGAWTYASAADTYTLSARKPPVGAVARLGAEKVERLEVVLPPVPRHSARVLNGSALQGTTVELDSEQAVTGMRHDFLVRTPIATEAEQRQSLEAARLRVPQRQLRLTFRHFPTVAIHPGAGLRLEGARWSQGAVGTGEDLRAVELSLEARTLHAGPHEGMQAPDAGYTVELGARLERASDTAVELPPFRRPRYPLYVEGKVHSPGGGEQERTWLLAEDAKTSVLAWKVAVPLWNKTVSVPAEPGHFPGNFYFPPYKHARVLVALHFDRAALHRHLDWADGARLPQDGQGDGMLLGRSDTSQTSLTQSYQDGKPVWNLRRVSGADTGTVRMSEGLLLLQTQETPGVVSTAPTYDVSPQVEAARADLTAGVGGAMGETTATYRTAAGSAQAKLDGAMAETLAALEAAQAEVAAKVGEARAALRGALTNLSGRTAPLMGAAAEARAALERLK